MKKNRIKLITCVIAVMLLSGCGAQSAQPESTETYTEKDNLKQAGLGAMSLLYDDTVWTNDEAQGTDSSIVFRDVNDSVLGISCSKETYYQHPLDMLNTSKQIYSTFTGYEETEEPAEISVQDDTWYEWSYRYQENGTTMIALQRFYAKNYYAYTISYVAEEKCYEAGEKEALKVMNSVVMNVPGNEEAEEKAKEFLVGEWDLQDAGYLVMNDDGTYMWYMESSKNEDNMHKGTYAGDVENSSVGFSEGEGIYFVLFPEVLYVEGEESRTANAKYDYLVSLEQMEDGSYQMINGSTFAFYNMKRQ